MKNVKRNVLAVAAAMAAMAVLSGVLAPPVDADEAVSVLTAKEKKAGWKLLFDGKTTQGWRGVNQKEFPAQGWQIENGVLIGLGKGGGDIVTAEAYASFDLTFDFMVSEGGNSGLKYFVVEYPPNAKDPKDKGSAIGLEYQMLDDERHPDAKKGFASNRTLASVYDLIPAEGKAANPPGQWNQGRVLVKGVHVEHWLNGKKVAEFERTSQVFRALVQTSKYAHYEKFGQEDKGLILLQDHGDRAAFRNIKIRPL